MKFQTRCACSHPWSSHRFAGRKKVRARSAFVGFVCAICTCRVPLPSVLIAPPAPDLPLPPLVIHEAKLGVRA